jgi:hypothetical protein
VSVRSRISITIGLVVVGVAMLSPVAAQANAVNDLLDQVGNTVNNITGNGSGGSAGGGGSTASPAPTPQSGTPPTYVPPAHGTVPYGQGTVGVVDVTPENTTPLPYDEGGGSEDVVVGRSRGEQTGSGYHGHVTLLTLLGNEIIGVDTGEGESSSGPLGPLNDALDDVCTQSGNSLCLNVLDVDSNTTKNGSSNSFSAVDLNVGAPGGPGISATAASSNGNISDDGNCQTANGGSGVANANVFGFTANALNSSSTSTACNNGNDSQQNSSQVLALGGNGVPLPQAGCENGTPNTNFTPLMPLVGAVCNADGSGSGQLDDPFGVREALSLFVLDLGGTPLAKATASSAESHAVAPGSGTNPPPVNPPGGCSNPPCGNGGPNGPGSHPSEPGNGGPSGPNGPNGPSAESRGKGNLPFTGTDLVRLALIGLAVTIIGLTLMGLADRRRRFAQVV